MTKLNRRTYLAALMATALALTPGTQALDTLEVTIEPITNTMDAHETTPTLGFDGFNNVVVYTRRALVGGVTHPGDIYYQLISSRGVRMGAPVRVSIDMGESTDDRLNDVSGENIVYTAVDPNDASRAVIRLHNMRSGLTQDLISEADTVHEARIHGNIVAWVQGPSGATRVEMIDISSIGGSAILSGSNPVSNVEVGSRYVVWEEFDGASSNIAAYDLLLGISLEVAATTTPERTPATFDGWIVWKQDSGTATSLWAQNVGAPSREPAFEIASATAPSRVQNPSIDGGLIAYESNADGNFDVFVYRLLDGTTHRVTNGPTDEILSNVYGSLVAFVDVAAISPFEQDVEIAWLQFVPIAPCPGGDSDGDGVCDDVDNCPVVPNPDQADLDGDGAGDACDSCPLDAGNDADGDGLCAGADNCPNASNADQADDDADGIGDVCDGATTPCAPPPGLLNGLPLLHIRTIAGNGVLGWSGDGGAALAASLNLPHDVFVDESGNVYIADAANQRVRRVDGRTGIITTVAGSGTPGSTGDGSLATDAQLNDPRFVTVDAAGNIFISESVGARVRRVDAATGVITTVGGGGAATAEAVAATTAALIVPSGLAFDGNGHLFLVETGRDRVRRIDAGADGLVTGAPDEIITTVAGTGGGGFSGDDGPATAALFSNPEDLGFDPAGNLLVADRLNHRVRRVSTGADDVVTGGEGENVVTVAGGGIEIGDGGPATAAQLNLPRGLAVDFAGNLFISEANAVRIRRVDAATRTITTVVGGGSALGEDIPAATARFFTPRGIATDRDGNLFTASLGDSRVRAVRLADPPPPDTLAPSTVAAANPAPVGGWNNTPVTVTLTATDNGGCGVLEIHYAINGGVETVVAGASATIAISTEGATSVSYFAVDAAGNAEPASAIGINIDLTPPGITIAQPTNGATFLLNASVSAEYHCSDALSGIASCSVIGGALDTSSVGNRTFTVQAVDAAGNSSSRTHHYSVGYAFDGFLSPLANLPMTNRGPAGRTFPVKFRLTAATGAFISDQAAITDVTVVPGACSTQAADVSVEATTLDVAGLTFDAATGVWQFNWKTARSQVGCWLVEVRLADGSVHRAAFELR